ncbi:MAG: PRC-barrel domain-containing protein [Candidatus Buchananbacteria bacterium]
MLISSVDLINLPVFSQSGKHLGKIISFDVDIDLKLIKQFYVKTGLIKGLWHQQLLISPSQVISISKEKMVVDDGVISNLAKETEKMTVATPVTE